MRFFKFQKPQAILNRTIHQYQQKVRTTQASKVATFYAGHWSFNDNQTRKKHTLEITPNLLVQIDHKPLSGQVISLTENELVFLDHYGYQLKITCENQRPVSVYDEAEDMDYPIE
ncbi:DUF4828 domain-containing protein [Latilactobacillus curvatus]|uniref:DUF4828 domain-containing protein n=1 Tax=Latilactobacillus curvatus JCM 1096 = DSM 20019 TaxID=1293592 RepID=A0AAJ0LE22_LATCU|nr:DUF4828 domain-containing protein [Latilactobacillus curvatus]KRK91202.1 hypothetical protein FC08_GL001329 [Latilactobacillus curvatus JCM 1096 = DSM 20019]MCT3530696.1 DUF4828 domain-containing protein [Latilactobacillus curvatus]MDG2989151.1 DUF4828 domain-containing protein [Latilactobacillus curvatus]QAS49928.1 DUF4828 domain-containing protein [Latilactobacillus curvatus JCM 1096 = DSM 20019]QWF36036.1 DUF4828 domain-containing protein [Latilactobacillus curvatus]